MQAEQVDIVTKVAAKLYERVQLFARRHQQDIDEAVSALLERGLAADKAEETLAEWTTSDDPAIDREMEAYVAMYPTLKMKYLGQHVAIYGGKLIDRDPDFEALYTRIEQAYPDEYVLLITVAEELLPTFYHRSPRLVQDS